MYHLILFDFVWMFLYLSPCFIRIICKLHATVSRSCSWKLIKMSSDIYIKKKGKVSIVCVCVCVCSLLDSWVTIEHFYWICDLLNHVWVHYERTKRNPSSPGVLCLNVCERVCVLVILACVCVCVWCSRGPVQCQLNQVSAGQTVNTVSLPSSTLTPDPPLQAHP